MLAQTARADDDPDPVAEAQEQAAATAERVAEVKERVDRLYREAGSATQEYNAAKEATDAQQEVVNTVLGEAAQAADEVNAARRTLGQFAAAQYRHGNASETATLLLVDDPQSFFDLSYKLDRLTGQQQHALDQYTERQGAAAQKRAEATTALEELEESQGTLQEQKETVQGKLSTARELLAGLNEEETAQLAELERLEREEAERKAEERRLEREQREREEAEEAAAAAAEAERLEQERLEQERLEQEQREQEEAEAEQPAPEDPEPEPEPDPEPEPEPEPQPDPEPDPGPEDGYAAKAELVLAFAEKQLGKPYVWGAAGPSTYDCSGLTQAAWREAGVDLPRVTYDQVEFGTRVSRSDMLPGDLVFFYDDVSHVGIYIGDGQMIHAPRPGDVVKVESIDYMPFHSAVRPA
jgi:cell wall-associated NlpC family hydrolase